MKPQVYMMRQDDPFKCTAAKLAKFRIAEPVRFIKKDTIVLNPFADSLLTKNDVQVAGAVCAVDCSWERADEVAKHQRIFSAGIGRRLPAILAANPTNYAKLSKLSSAEALAAAMYILGDKQAAAEIMNKFKWGHTFLELNADLLEDYSNAGSEEEVKQVEQAYFPNLK
jgi:pre-rRNA-processing protein TSR3